MVSVRRFGTSLNVAVPQSGRTKTVINKKQIPFNEVLFENLVGAFDLDSLVGIRTHYGPDSPGIESLWGVRFSAPVQTGPRVHPASCTMGTGSFPGVKSGRDVTLTPHPLLVPWS